MTTPARSHRPRTTLIIPAFNEADRIDEGFSRLRVAADEGRLSLDDLEVLYVDDGSTDGTADAAAELVGTIPHGRVVVLSTNGGKGAAVAAGVRSVVTEQLIFTDADLAIDPRQIPDLLAGLSTAPLAVGSRAIQGHIVYDSMLRTMAGRCFNALVRHLSQVKLPDTQCGCKAMRTGHAKILFDLLQITAYAFDVELIARAFGLGWGIAEIPVSWSDVGGSHIHLAGDSLKMLRDLAGARARFGAASAFEALALDRTTSDEEIAWQSAGSALEAAPILTHGDGRRWLLATGVPSSEAHELLGRLKGTIGGHLERIGLGEVANAASIGVAIA